MEASVATTQVPDQFEAFEQFIRDLATTEGRLATTAGIVFLAVLVGLVVVPLLGRGGGRLVRRVLPDGVVEILDVIDAYLPTRLGVALTRGVQMVVLFTAGVALLVTWGMVDLAVTVVRLFGETLPFAGQVVLTLALVVVAYIAADVLEEAIHGFSTDAERVTEHQAEVMLRVGHVAILAVSASGLLTLWGLDLSGVLVGAGVLGIVLGLAARKTLGSVIAGFVLMLTRPFTVGDWVEVGDHEGAVTGITIMHTEIREFNGELVIIPNDLVSEQPIRNRSHQDILRLNTGVGVDYDTDPEYAEQVALDAIQSVDGVVDAPPPETTTASLDASAVSLQLLYWIDDPNPMSARRARESVIYAVKARFEEEGIGMPYPHRTLSTQSDEGFLSIDHPDGGGDQP
ncbi:MAG: small-conductance mechanosensitive channel [halophilic archaeon J07HX64]|jgi:Small-conductance mechanosensitive channel|nr:MAG: small-conductance mechanosensitive channel [halophilic archaeon J07HX64]